MIIPAGYRVLVKADAVDTESAGGIIYVQDEKLERAAQTNGTLVRVGIEAWEDAKEPWAVVGDRVTYIRHAGKPIVDPMGSTMEQTWDQFSYLWNMAVPPPLTGHGVVRKLFDKATGEDIDPATGDPRRGLASALGSGVGINIYEPNLELSTGMKIMHC